MAKHVAANPPIISCDAAVILDIESIQLSLVTIVKVFLTASSDRQ